MIYTIRIEARTHARQTHAVRSLPNTHNLHNANFHNPGLASFDKFGTANTAAAAAAVAPSSALSHHRPKQNEFRAYIWRPGANHRHSAFICYSGSGKTNSTEHFSHSGRISRIHRLPWPKNVRIGGGAPNFSLFTALWRWICGVADL